MMMLLFVLNVDTLDRTDKVSHQKRMRVSKVKQVLKIDSFVV